MKLYDHAGEIIHLIGSSTFKHASTLIEDLDGSLVSGFNRIRRDLAPTVEISCCPETITMFKVEIIFPGGTCVNIRQEE